MTQIPVSTNKFGNKPKPQSMEDFIGGAPSVVSERPSTQADSSRTVINFEDKPIIPVEDPPVASLNVVEASNRPKKYNKTPKTASINKIEDKDRGALYSVNVLVGSEQDVTLRNVAFERHVSKSRIVREALDDWFAKNGIKLPDAEAK